MSTDTANRPLLILAALALAGLATAAQAGPNLVPNGSFSTFSGGSGTCSPGGVNTQQVTNSDLSGWSTDSNYTFALNSSNYGSFANSYGGGSCIGLQPTITASPDGGNFIGADASYQNPGPYTLATTPLSLVSGLTYTLTFYMAAGQQTTFSGATSDKWTVGLGPTGGTAGTTPNQATASVALPSGGFSGWVGETMQFVAGATNVLWFMGSSTAAQGQPPFILLDGVDMQVPEPPAYGMLADLVRAVGEVASAI